jgi:iron complex outermembrane recepter protein
METSTISRAVQRALFAMAGTMPVLAAAQSQAAPPLEAPAVSTVPAATAPSGTSTADLDRVTITGIRGSLAKSVATKREADSITDSIAAEDIGKFPQQNMAESLQRITGVQITRSKGEGQSVSVRGLDPKFTQVLYNGRQLPSASGNRSFDFTILSADFISALDVYKAPVADVRDGGLSATVNVKTARAIDIGKRRVVFTAEGVNESNSKSTTPHLSGFFSDVFLDDKLGVSFAIDHSKRKLAVQRYEAFGFEPASVHANDPGDPRNTHAFNHAASFGIDEGTRERTSLMAAAQYRLTDRIELHADVLQSTFKSNLLTLLNAHRFTNITGSGATGTTDAAGNLDSYGSSGVDNRNTSRFYNTNNKLKSAAVGLTYEGDDLTVEADVSRGTSKTILNSMALEVIGRADVSYDYRSDPGGIPTVAYRNGYNPAAAGTFRALGFNGQDNQPTNDTTTDARIDGTYRLKGFFSSLQTGVALGDRRNVIESRLIGVSAKQLADALGVAYDPSKEGGSFDATPFMRTSGGSGFLSGYGGPSTFPSSWLSSDTYGLLSKLPLSQLEALSPPTRNNTLTANVKESTQALYLRGNFATADQRFTGNVGMRYVRTRQDTVGYIPDLTNISFDQGGAVTIVPDSTQQTLSRTYSNWLPSLNMRYKLTDTWQARVGAARVMSRPDLTSVTPTTTVNANVKTITSGNPNLKPYLANQYDVALEWYFNRESMVSLGVFYKDVKNFIVNTTTSETLLVKQTNGSAPVSTTFTRFQPGNGAATKLQGVELAYQQPFTFLPSPFDGFGTIANLTYIDAGKLATEVGGTPKTLPGVSKISYNLTGYYEKAGFGAYVSYNYRDGYRRDADNYFGDGSKVESYGQLDLSLSYKLTKNLSVTSAVTNVTNAAVKAVNDAGYGRGYEFAGRRVTLGMRVDL